MLFHRCPWAVAAVAAVIACEVVVRSDFLVRGDQELVISGLVTSVSSASCPRLYQGLLVTLMRLLLGALLGIGDLPPWLLLLVSALAGLFLHFVSGKGHVAVLQSHLQVSSEHDPEVLTEICVGFQGVVDVWHNQWNQSQERSEFLYRSYLAVYEGQTDEYKAISKPDNWSTVYGSVVPS